MQCISNPSKAQVKALCNMGLHWQTSTYPKFHFVLQIETSLESSSESACHECQNVGGRVVDCQLCFLTHRYSKSVLTKKSVRVKKSVRFILQAEDARGIYLD
jgi:hypothetical protein